MLYPSELPYAVETHVNLYELEREVTRAFEATLGEGMVLDIFANEYPGRIGVILFLKQYDKAEASTIARKLQEEFATQGLRVGILALPASAMKENSS